MPRNVYLHPDIPPGPLSRRDAETLSRALYELNRLLGLDVMPPLNIQEAGGNPVLGVDSQIVVSSGLPGVTDPDGNVTFGDTNTHYTFNDYDTTNFNYVSNFNYFFTWNWLTVNIASPGLYGV